MGVHKMKKHKKYTGNAARDFKTNLTHGKARPVGVRYHSNTLFLIYMLVITSLYVLYRLVFIYEDTMKSVREDVE